MKASEGRVGGDESECRGKQQGLGYDGWGRDGYLEFSRNEEGIRALKVSLGFMARHRDGAGKVKAFILWFAWTGLCVATGVRCLTGQDTWGSQRQKS